MPANAQATATYRALRNAGATPSEAAALTAIAGAESGWQSGAYNDGYLGAPEHSVGVFQVNLDAHEGQLIPGTTQRVSKANMHDLDLSARYALGLYRSSGGGPWSVTGLRGGTTLKINQDHLLAAQWGSRDYGDPTIGTNTILQEATGGQYSAPNNSSNPAGGSAGGGGFGPDVYPSGGELLNSNDGLVLRYQVYPGVFVEWLVSNEEPLSRSGYNPGVARAYSVPPGELVDYKAAGDAAELGELSAAGYDSITEFMDATIGMYFSPFDPARDDPGVQAVIARIMANPDAPLELIDAWIRQTDHWAKTNDMEKDWNSLSPAEQNQRRRDTQGRVEQEYWASVGVRLRMGDPKLKQWAEEVASGQKTFSQVTQEIRDEARQNPESPFSRSIRSENIDQRKFGNDVENSAEVYRQEAMRWGIKLGANSADRWARQVTTGKKSQADFETYLRTTAQIMFPWKDPEIATEDAAAPWLESYKRTMEIGDVTLFQPQIQRAMQEGMSLPDFETMLRKQPEWFQTKNAKETLSETVGRVGEIMGFV